MSLHAKINGTWVEATNVFTKAEGAWVPIIPISTTPAPGAELPPSPRRGEATSLLVADEPSLISPYSSAYDHARNIWYGARFTGAEDGRGVFVYPQGGPLSIPTLPQAQVQPMTVAVDPTNGDVYLPDNPSSGAAKAVLKLDAAAGTWGAIWSPNVPNEGDLYWLAFDELGTLYGACIYGAGYTAAVYRIDKATGERTLIGRVDAPGGPGNYPAQFMATTEAIYIGWVFMNTAEQNVVTRMTLDGTVKVDWLADCYAGKFGVYGKSIVYLRKSDKTVQLGTISADGSSVTSEQLLDAEPDPMSRNWLMGPAMNINDPEVGRCLYHAAGTQTTLTIWRIAY